MVYLDVFKNISFKTRKQCVVCGTDCSKPVIELPDFPLTEIYVKEKVSEKIGFVDQAFHFCDNCGHGQIMNIIDPKIIYGSNYVTRTSTSQSAIGAIEIFLDFVDDIIKDRPIKNVIDIGCSDLYTLKKFKNRAEKLYGIDPTLNKKEKQLIDEKIKIIGDFVENVSFRELDIDLDVVLSSHTLEHIENPKELIQILVNNANSETLFFFQFPGLGALVRDCRFDQIFHQHLNYFSLKSVIHMLEEVGAELINVRSNDYHWGSLMIAFKKSDQKNNVDRHCKFEKQTTLITKKQILEQYQLFKDKMDLTNRLLASFKNETVYGFGAALMLPVLNYYVPNLCTLKNIIDDDKSKEDSYYINTPLKVIHTTQADIKESIVVITAINSKQAVRSIFNKLLDLNVKEIIAPVNLI